MKSLPRGHHQQQQLQLSSSSSYLNSRIFSMSVLKDFSWRRFLLASAFFLLGLTGLWLANSSNESWNPLHAMDSLRMSSSLISFTSFSARMKIFESTPGLISFTYAVPTTMNVGYLCACVRTRPPPPTALLQLLFLSPSSLLMRRRERRRVE